MKISWSEESNDAKEPGFDLIPDGIYEIEIDNVQSKFPKSPDSKAGEMVVVTFKVAESPYIGRLIWHYLCVNHESHKVRNIAKNDLRLLYTAAKVDSEEDTNALVGKTIRGEIMHKEGNNGFPDSNTVVNYEPSETISQIDAPISFEDDDIPF